MGDQQRQILFEGDVQGVGFRYTACRVAGRYDIAGHVRNLPDGRVECVVEGDSAEIDAFLDDLREAMRGHIRRQSEQVSPYSGRFGPFSVKY